MYGRIGSFCGGADRLTLTIALASHPISTTCILAKMQLSYSVGRFPPEKVFGIISSQCCPFCKSHPTKKIPTEFHLQFLRISRLTCDSSCVCEWLFVCCWAGDCYQSLVYTSFMYNVCLKNGFRVQTESGKGSSVAVLVLCSTSTRWHEHDIDDIEIGK